MAEKTVTRETQYTLPQGLTLADLREIAEDTKHLPGDVRVRVDTSSDQRDGYWTAVTVKGA